MTVEPPPSWDEPRSTFLELATAMMDEDPDVTVEGDVLLVRGKPFGWRDGSALLLRLPQPRAVDLSQRGVAERLSDEQATVLIADQELWAELASEAHDYVGEPSVGGKS